MSTEEQKDLSPRKTPRSTKNLTEEYKKFVFENTLRKAEPAKPKQELLEVNNEPVLTPRIA